MESSQVIPLSPQKQNTQNMETLNALYNRMQIPKLYHGKTFKTFRGYTDEIQQAKEALEQGKSIFLTGNTGTGKTHLSVSLMLEWLVKNKPESMKNYPRFLPAVELFLELKQTFGNDGTEKEILDIYSRIPLLCIDDVGAEKISDWSRQSFYTLIDRRYREMKQTILTSNLSLDKISSLIDDRISSRIIEMGIVIELNGNDFRLSLNH